MSTPYKSTLSLQHSLSRLQSAYSYISSQRYSYLHTFNLDILTIEGYYVDCHSYNQHKFDLILDFRIVHTEPMEAQIAVKKKHKVWKQLKELTLRQLYEVHSLQIRPYKLRNESVVCLLGTTNRTVSVMQEIIPVAVPMSPSTRAVKRQSVETAADDHKSPGEIVALQCRELSASTFASVSSTFPSLTPLLSIDLFSPSSLLTLEHVLNIKDRLSFEAILLRLDPVTERGQGRASRVMIIRDIHRNDTAKMVVYMKKPEELDRLREFSVLRFNWAYRVISSTLNPYFRLYIDSDRSLTVVQEHSSNCETADCPCKWLQANAGKGALKMRSGDGREVYLPAIHLAAVDNKYFKDISFTHLEKSYFSSDSLLIDLQFLVLEFACSLCNKRVLSSSDTTCGSCQGPITFNIRAGVVLDDSSGVLAEAVVERGEVWVEALELEAGLVECLKDILKITDEPVVNLSGSNIPEWVRKRVYQKSGKVMHLILQCQSYVSHPEHIPDSYMLYLHSCALPSEISLNRKLPSALSSARPSLRLLAISPLF